MPALSQFAAAIADAEGYNVAGSVPQRNNNPGDLRGWSDVPTDANGYSVFPTAQAGWNALEQQLDDIAAGSSSYYTPEMSIAQMGAVWADGDPDWAANVAAYLGVSTSAMIGSFLGGAFAPGAASGLEPMPVSPLPSLLSDDDVQRALMITAIGLGVVLLIRRLT